jgi:ATP-dependent RNA helicase RhlE
MPLRKLLSLFRGKKKETTEPGKTDHKPAARHQATERTTVRHSGGQNRRPHPPRTATYRKPDQSKPHHQPRAETSRPATYRKPTQPKPQFQPRAETHRPAAVVHHPPQVHKKPAAPTGPQLKFDQLGLAPFLLKAIAEEGYADPTPIQQQTIPLALDGKDLLGCAQTGTGKTAAFALPILQKLTRPEVVNQQFRDIKALIVTPTRELAAQIGQSFSAYGRHSGLRYAVIYGGVFQGHQQKAMKGGVDILVATPGRLLDMMNQRLILLHKVEILVLDEADRMLDMGFINDIRKIVAKVPIRRQTLFFSATMPPEIRHLAGSILDNPVSVSVTPDTTAAETVEQSLYFVERNDKPSLLKHLLSDELFTRALVFTRTKVRADRVARKLTSDGIPASAIHGDKSQGARERVLAGFKDGSIRVLVASDIVSRGIDIENISHVVNFDVPQQAESYIHRIGRTGRAGAVGSAITFCDAEERQDVREIEKLLDKSIPVVEDHPYHSRMPVHEALSEHRRRTGRKPQQGRSGQRPPRAAQAGQKPRQFPHTGPKTTHASHKPGSGRPGRRG